MTKAEKRAKAEQEAQKQASSQSSTGESQQQQGEGEGSNEQSSTSQEEQKGEESDAGIKQQEITENQDPTGYQEINSLEPLSVFRDTQEGSNQLPVDNEELKMAADKVLEQKNQSGEYEKLHDADDKNLELLKEEGIVDQESMRPPELKETALSSSDQSGEEKKNSVADEKPLPLNVPDPTADIKAQEKADGAKQAPTKFSNSGKLAPGELTTGQKLARTHVSTGNHDVTEIRDAASIFIDKIHSLRERYSSSDVQRWASAAITQVELALGLAEKAATA